MIKNFLKKIPPSPSNKKSGRTKMMCYYCEYIYFYKPGNTSCIKCEMKDLRTELKCTICNNICFYNYNKFDGQIKPDCKFCKSILKTIK